MEPESFHVIISYETADVFVHDAAEFQDSTVLLEQRDEAVRIDETELIIVYTGQGFSGTDPVTGIVIDRLVIYANPTVVYCVIDSLVELCLLLGVRDVFGTDQLKR